MCLISLYLQKYFWEDGWKTARMICLYGEEINRTGKWVGEILFIVYPPYFCFICFVFILFLNCLKVLAAKKMLLAQRNKTDKADVFKSPD